MNKWYQIREQSAGKIRLELLWVVYKIFGIRFLKFILWFVCLFIVPFAKPARIASKKYMQILNKYLTQHNFKKIKISTFSHIYTFACAIMDKISAQSDKKTKIKFTFHKNADWDKFQSYLNENSGVFLICSHLGNIEALSAFSNGQTKKMHAFMQISQNSTFHQFMIRHNIKNNTLIYPTENIDIGVASMMYDFLRNGDLVMMAGDRTSPTAKTRYETVQFLDTNCRFPIGTFKFAKSLSHPIFSICVMNISHEKYKIYVKQLDATTPKDMINQYAKFLEKLVIMYPKQWFNFFDFFEVQEKQTKN
jgi:predicted LPLAT superfamily acyltransferase